MERKEPQQESKVAKMRRRIEEICKKHGWKCTENVLIGNLTEMCLRFRSRRKATRDSWR